MSQLPPGANPLNHTHCDCLNKVLESIPQALQLVQACKDCGLDVSEFEQQFQQQLEMAQKLKAKFFPGNP